MIKIFHVDDDVDVREVVRFALSEHEFSVESFGNPMEAIKVMAGHSAAEVPGLVLVDYLMPELNGLGFIERARSLEAYKDVPFILCSARGEFVDEAIPSNLLLLPKPMELEDLIGMVRKHTTG